LGPLLPRLRVTGANMAFRTCAIEQLRFDPSLGVNQNSLGGGEETAFVARIRARGGEVVWVPKMRLRHYVDPARLQIGYLVRLSRDRGKSSIREKGIPPGPRVAGAPVRLWIRYAAASAAAILGYVRGRRVRAAGRLAKSEYYRAKIAECRALARRQTAPSVSPGK
jgi:hypothetical protein